MVKNMAKFLFDVGERLIGEGQPEYGVFVLQIVTGDYAKFKRLYDSIFEPLARDYIHNYFKEKK